MEVLELAGEEERLIPVVAMQTIAANLGSMATPIGNPQNLYLYSHYQMSLGEFFRSMLPLTAASGLLILLFLLYRHSTPLSLPKLTPPAISEGRRLGFYLILFVLCLAAGGESPACGAVMRTVALAHCPGRPPCAGSGWTGPCWPPCRLLSLCGQPKPPCPPAMTFSRPSSLTMRRYAPSWLARRSVMCPPPCCCLVYRQRDRTTGWH